MRRLPAVLALAFVIGAGACSTGAPEARDPATTVPARPTTTTGVTTTTAAPTTTTTTGAPPCDRPHAAGQAGDSFEFDGVDRAYTLFVPSAYDGRRALPVVFNFHGYGGNGGQQMLYSDLDTVAEREGFLVVAPDGQGTAETRHWNLTGEAGFQNDVAMTGALLDHLAATLCIDARRAYATGMSYGGVMTSVLACTANDRFAAFAPVAGMIAVPGCARDRTVAIVGFMGTDDPTIPFEGGQVRCCGQPTLPSAPDAMAGWAAHNACAPTFTDARLGSEVRRRTWSRCRPGGDVAFYIVDGGGHTWPGSPIDNPRLGHTTRQINADELMWQFFEAHPLQ
jgi:polyhydroxybutyrate depolymerase